jgi:hypothetical protein
MARSEGPTCNSHDREVVVASVGVRGEVRRTDMTVAPVGPSGLTTTRNGVRPAILRFSIIDVPNSSAWRVVDLCD